MSNAIAVAAVTATLVRVLDEALASQGAGGVPNVHATTLRPDMLVSANGEVRGVNVFLYQVTPNGAWRGADLPTRRSDGTLVTRPQQALDLHYLLTFSGDELKLEPQRLLGLTASVLHGQPTLSRELVRETIVRAIDADSETYLKFADLAEQIEVVRLTMLTMNLEELSRLWSMFTPTAYRLSVPYQGTVVLLESDLSPQAALPVRQRNLDAVLFRGPVVSQAAADSRPGDPVTAGTVVRIEGAGLGGSMTRVRFTGPGGAVEVKPPASAVSETRITVAVPWDVRAGVHGVQVVQPLLVGEPPEERGGVESNASPLVVVPTVTGEVTAAPGAEAGVVDVTVPVNPPVGARQRVVLLLNERGAPSDRAPRAYSFVSPARVSPAVPDPAPSVVIPTRGVASGSYLVRVQVDGAANVLDVGADGRYDSPAVTFP